MVERVHWVHLSIFCKGFIVWLAKPRKCYTQPYQKFEVFWGLTSKKIKFSWINNPQSFILNLKNSVLVPASKFEVFEGCHKWGFFKDSSKKLQKYGLFCYVFYKISHIFWDFSRNPQKSSKSWTSSSTQNLRFIEVLLN